MLKNTCKPFAHQSASVEQFIKNQYRIALFHDLGVGKTLSSLLCFAHLKLKKPSGKMLVVCPISLIESAWGEDIQRFTNFSYINLRKVKKIPQTTDADIIIANFEMLIGSKADDILNLFNGIPAMICVDESSRCRGHKTQTSKALIKASKKFPARVIMSATPAPNDESEYWAQMVFLSESVFPTNYFVFRHRYFTLSRGNFQFPQGALSKGELQQMMKRGFKFRLLETKKNEFFGLMAPYVSWVRKEDVLDLPDQIDEVRKFPLGLGQSTAYRKMKNHLITELQGKDVVASIALTKLMRLRQLASGFSMADDGQMVRTPENPKLAECLAVLEEIGDKQVLIFCEYHREIDDLLEQLGERAAALDGRTDDKDATIKAFKDGITKVLICHPRSGGVGLSFNAVDYLIFYSLSYSSENYIQARGRIMRANKKNNATYIYLIAEGTIEEDILDIVRNKHDKMLLIERFLK